MQNYLLQNYLLQKEFIAKAFKLMMTIESFNLSNEALRRSTKSAEADSSFPNFTFVIPKATYH